MTRVRQRFTGAFYGVFYTARLKSQLAVQTGMVAEGVGGAPREVTVEKIVEKVRMT